MRKNYFLVFICIFFYELSFGQTEKDVEQIVGKYDIAKIKEKQLFQQKKAELEKRKAIEVAKANNWPLTFTGKNGSFNELMKILDGYPIYFSTDNANAAKSTRANHLNTGGSLGLNLNGEGMVARVWDGGRVRASHNLLSGRVTVVDNLTGALSDHSTHVAGTIMASDLSASTKGMAWKANARTFNWTNDMSEALSEIQQGMLISNHSYGVPFMNDQGVVQLPLWYIGAYSQDAREWDEVAYLSPYYLMVVSAGNEGNNTNPSPSSSGYDKLTGEKNSKNNLVVANATDATVDAAGNVTAPIVINSSSSEGPSDDKRIKPDITGNGTDVLSSLSTTDTATGSMSGTSMAAPNVAGTLLLLQQHYKNSTNSFMKASTLKGLACHTADDAGKTGPDPIYGWGLLNAKKAAEAITGNGVTSWVSEETLNQSQTYTINVNSNGATSLIASITWTDVPGVANTGSGPVNDPTPALVNDLDIRVTNGSTTFYPWRLPSNLLFASTRTGDNNIDNVEVVKIDTPVAGNYTITITHKGTLQQGPQDYSLVVTGITSNFGIVSTSSDLEVCSNQDAVYSFNYKHGSGGATSFSAVGLPTGASASFSPSSLNANGTVTMTVSGLTNVTPGEYNVGILGNNGVETETRFKNLIVYSTNFQPLTLTSPANGITGVAPATSLKWVKNQNAENYNVQVATDSNFTNIIVNATVTNNLYQLTGLNQGTYYYWRVIPSNRCGTALASSAIIRNFQTGVLVCGYNFTATDFSNALIAETANAVATVPLSVSGGHTIGDLNVNINISHQYIQDMTVSLIGPSSIGSPVIDLLKEVCGDNENINCTIDDSGSSPICSGDPALTGIVSPSEPLSDLNGLLADGVWTLRVEDPYNGDGGAINAFGISICKVSPSLSVAENELLGVKIYPNPTGGDITIDLGNNILEGEINLLLTDIQGRHIMSKKSTVNNDVLSLNNLSNGVYLLSVENGNKKTIKKIVLNK